MSVPRRIMLKQRNFQTAPGPPFSFLHAELIALLIVLCIFHCVHFVTGGNLDFSLLPFVYIPHLFSSTRSNKLKKL